MALSFTKFYLVLAVLVGVIGAIHTLVVVPMWFHDKVAWHSVKRGDLEFLKRPYGYAANDMRRRSTNAVVMKDGTYLYNQFTTNYRIMSTNVDVNACLKKVSAQREFSYRRYDWRVEPFRQWKSGVILLGNIPCYERDDGAVRLHLMLRHIYWMATYYFALVGVWVLSCNRLDAWFSNREMREFSHKADFRRKNED